MRFFLRQNGNGIKLHIVLLNCNISYEKNNFYPLYPGFVYNQYGAVFEWFQGSDNSKKGFSQWSPFSEKTKYFQPSEKDFMINYRVDNLEKLVEQLKKENVTVVDKIETYEYGKFVHIMDIEGNKIELWEPNDIEYEKLGQKMGSKTTK
ncbi:VOC family protein [Chryseobacterium indologenes]|uniref:VOC family protein n=1 Tax=Chryseobacterium indologenes TaxID=253 RepID=A0A411DMZ8_CHRID|nr:VOC family protein [Chryseobacterium indologenes]